MALQILIVILLFILLIFATLYFGIVRVSEGEVVVIERLGKFSRILGPGINFTIPYIEYIRDRLPTSDITIDIDPQDTITKDNALLKVDTIVFIRILDPRKAIYKVDNYRNAVEQLVLTSLRAIIGNLTLDEALSAKEEIVVMLKDKIENDTPDWGITVTAFDIQSIMPTDSLRIAMEEQAAAERKKRATETMAEADKKAAILKAEGQLASAKLEAEAQLALANASAEAMRLIGEGLDGKELPALFLLGDRYINSLNQLSQSENKTFVVYPADMQATIKGLLGNVFKK
jgi:regulator of protease activity HflC (stomatin/prohibitin superfamily)